MFDHIIRRFPIPKPLNTGDSSPLEHPSNSSPLFSALSVLHYTHLLLLGLIVSWVPFLGLVGVVRDLSGRLSEGLLGARRSRCLKCSRHFETDSLLAEIVEFVVVKSGLLVKIIGVCKFWMVVAKTVGSAIGWRSENWQERCSIS